MLKQLNVAASRQKRILLIKQFTKLFFFSEYLFLSPKCNDIKVSNFVIANQVNMSADTGLLKNL